MQEQFEEKLNVKDSKNENSEKKEFIARIRKKANELKILEVQLKELTNKYNQDPSIEKWDEIGDEIINLGKIIRDKKSTDLSDAEKIFASKFLQDFISNSDRRENLDNDSNSQNLKDVILEIHYFEENTLEEVLDSIKKNKQIDKINVLEKLQNPNFRFRTIDDAELSFIVSESLSIVQKNATETKLAEIRELGVIRNVEIADEFAIEMFNIVKELRENDKITTYRDTIQYLNDKNVPTNRGGKWHLKTLQDLSKRWEKLKLKF